MVERKSGPRKPSPGSPSKQVKALKGSGVPVREPPILKGKPKDEKSQLGFKDLKKRVGVTVLSEASHYPVHVPMVKKGREWVPEAGPLMRGEAKAPYQYWRTTDPDTTAYASMHKYYRAYRRDSLVRGCINTLAFFSTNKGFETVLEPPVEMDEEKANAYTEGYKQVKDEIDKANKHVNLDKILFSAVVKSKVFGKCGFEIYPADATQKRFNLLPLDSTRLDPILSDKWALESFSYESNPDFYSPDQVLYFADLQLEADLQGLSSVEPILGASEARQKILHEDLPEAAETLWAGVGSVQVDTTGMNSTDAEDAVASIQTEWAPGKWVFHNQKVTVTVADMKPDLDKLRNTIRDYDREIIGNFQVPRFLLAREEQVNRATAYAELEAFVSGPVAAIQHDLKRMIESQWYDMLARKSLGLGPKAELPILVKHNWRKISTADYVELFSAVSQAYAQGMGWINQEKAYEIAGFDPKELERKRERLMQIEETDVLKEVPPTEVEKEVPSNEQLPKGRFVTRKDAEGKPYRYFWKDKK